MPRIITKARTADCLYSHFFSVSVFFIHCISQINRSPGFGIALVAETTTGALYSTDILADPGALPEDAGVAAAQALLEEIYKVLVPYFLLWQSTFLMRPREELWIRPIKLCYCFL